MSEQDRIVCALSVCVMALDIIRDGDLLDASDIARRTLKVLEKKYSIVYGIDDEPGEAA